MRGYIQPHFIRTLSSRGEEEEELRFGVLTPFIHHYNAFRLKTLHKNNTITNCAHSAHLIQIARIRQSGCGVHAFGKIPADCAHFDIARITRNTYTIKMGTRPATDARRITNRRLYVHAYPY